PLTTPPLRTPPLFPYTTLFRSSSRAHAIPRAASPVRLRRARWISRLHVLRRELPEPGAGRTRRRPLQLPRLLPERRRSVQQGTEDRKSTRLNSSHDQISYAVFC